MTSFPYLAQHLFNVPLAISPDKAEIIVAALADRLGISQMFRRGGAIVTVDTSAMMTKDESSGVNDEPDCGYDIVSGIAIVHIQGTLVQKSRALRPVSGMTGYDGIRQNIAMALEDPDVDAVMLDIDSPGGEVAGCFDLVDAIYASREVKPIWAVLSENACSAAYAIASAASIITVPRTGMTGSVGVICMHVDFSKALGEAGVNVTLITYGDRKADGSEFKALSKDALNRFQADIDAMGDLFVKTVARNRAMSPAAVRKTEASTFLGARGVEIGFADAVMAPDEAFRALLREIG